MSTINKYSLLTRNAICCEFTYSDDEFYFNEINNILLTNFKLSV